MRSGLHLHLLWLGAALVLGFSSGGAGSPLRAEEMPHALLAVRVSASPDASTPVQTPAQTGSAAPDAFAGLEPLAPAALGRMRGGHSAPSWIAPPAVDARIRFWDEIGRPPQPLPPQDGVISSTSRVLR